MAKRLNFKNRTKPTNTDTSNFIKNMQDLSFKMTKVGQDITDIELTSAEVAIKQSLINALHLQEGGNVLFPEKGAPLVKMLFNTNATETEQRDALMSYIKVNEPRISINNLSLNFTVNEFNEKIANITLQYSFPTSTEIHQVAVELQNRDK